MADVMGKMMAEDLGEEQVEVVIEEETPQPVEEEEQKPKEEPGSKEELARLVSELNLLKGQQAGTKEILEGLKGVLEKVSQQPPPQQPQKPEPPKEDYLTFRKRIEELMITDPVKGLEEMLGRYVQEQIVPAFQQLAGQTTATTLATSKAIAQQDPTNKLVMEKWGREVEDVVKTLTPGPDIYDRACKQVAMNHLMEIVQIQVQNLEAQKQQQVPPAKGAVPPTTAASTGGPTKKVIKITPREYEEAKMMGLDPIVYKQIKEEQKGGRR